MKYTKKVRAIGASILLTASFVDIKIQGMKPTEFTIKSRRRGVPVQPSQVKPERYKSNIVWVTTLDNKLMEVPQWQIDQMKEVQQVGENSKDNPAHAPMVSGDQLISIQTALQNASDLEKFRKFYSDLSDDQQRSLLADAFNLGMQGLASLLITYMFPVEVQQQMGANAIQPAGIIASVVQYLLMEKNRGNKIDLWPYFKDDAYVAMVEFVRCKALSPNGEYVVVDIQGLGRKDKWGYGDFSFSNSMIWNKKTGKKIELVDVRGMECVAFSSDSERIIIGTEEQLRRIEGKTIFQNELILSNIKTGEKIKAFQEHNWVTACVAFSHDDNLIIAGSKHLNRSNNPAVYDVKTGHLRYGFSDNRSVRNVTFNPKNNDIAIAFGDTNNNLMLFDGKTYAEKRNFHGLNIVENVYVVFSPDGEYIVGGSDKLILWNVETGDQIKILEGHDDEPIWCVAFSSDGNYIVSGSKKYLIVWDGKTGALLQKFNVNTYNKNFVMFGLGNQSIVCGKEGTDYSRDYNLIEFQLIFPQTLNFIANKLNLAQARFLYHLYLAKINNVPAILDPQDLDYQIFTTLPDDVQKVVKTFLSFELTSDIFEKEIQQKMKALRASLFYVPGYLYGRTEKTHTEKIKAVQNAMRKLEKDSVAYKACAKLLTELELEAALM